MLKSTQIIKKLVSPLEKFFHKEASAGIFLLIAALLALVWANSPYSELYQKILHKPLGVYIGKFSLSFSLHHFVNDALMAIFFFVVGLEIKRELSVGELSSPKKASLPIFAALGGMLVPALCYFVFNPEGPAKAGWGIPMATDIAFAVGVLSLLSKRAPFSLKVFLLALAIVDDLGAVLVIAVFYSKEIYAGFLALSGLTIFIIFCAGKLGVRNMAFYVFAGVFLWFFVLKSGVHSTVAGVILGFMCPARNREQATWEGISALSAPKSYKSSKKLSQKIRFLYPPAHRLIADLHPYVAWLIMPLFAFFNAGVEFKSGFSFAEFSSHPVSLGILFGLLLGKPIGILLFCFLAVRLKLAVYPSGFNRRRLVGVSFLAGIGFTMALFISHLAFNGQIELAVYSKLSILIASLLALLTGLVILLCSGDFSREQKETPAPKKVV